VRTVTVTSHVLCSIVVAFALFLAYGAVLYFGRIHAAVAFGLVYIGDITLLQCALFVKRRACSGLARFPFRQTAYFRPSLKLHLATFILSLLSLPFGYDVWLDVLVSGQLCAMICTPFIRAYSACSSAWRSRTTGEGMG
jgi:hypothetical protein